MLLEIIFFVIQSLHISAIVDIRIILLCSMKTAKFTLDVRRNQLSKQFREINNFADIFKRVTIYPKQASNALKIHPCVNNKIYPEV